MHTNSVFTFLCALAFVALLITTGCDKNDDDAATSGTPVTLTYPSGRIMAVGAYEPGTSTRTGEWKEYFDQEGSPQQWQRTYTAGVWDKSQDWREWNPDASIRNDASDH